MPTSAVTSDAPHWAALPLLRAMRAGTLDRLDGQVQHQHHPKGHILFTQDDVADWVYVVQSGWIKLFRETIDGDEVILDLLPAGHVFGETAHFFSGAYPYGAEVVGDAVILVLPAAVINQEIQNHPPFALTLMRHMAHNQLDRDIEHQTLQSTAQRVGCFLLRLCQKDATGAQVISLPLDKYLIATYLGMKPETFSRSLPRLTDDLGLRIDGAHIHVPRLSDLITYTCRACSNVFPCEKEGS